MRNRIIRLLRGEEAQAAVESALAIPVSMFVVLGILQMGMLQQARFMADYAAYRAARAASTQRLECPFVKKAVIAALVPALGRSDDESHWMGTFNNFSNNKNGSLPVTLTHWDLQDVHKPFDKPISPSENPEKVRVRLRFYYQMEIPFANWLFAKYFLAENGIEQWANEVDPLMTARQYGLSGGSSGGDSEGMADFVIVKSYFNQNKFVAPIYASWSMRMFSQADSATSGTCQ